MILSQMTSPYRNARWYYVSAVAYYGIGDTVRAQNLLQKAIQMDPNNPVYRQLWREYSYEPSYSESRSYYSPFGFIGKIILGIMLARTVFYMIQMLSYSLLLGH